MFTNTCMVIKHIVSNFTGTNVHVCIFIFIVHATAGDILSHCNRCVLQSGSATDGYGWAR